MWPYQPRPTATTARTLEFKIDARARDFLLAASSKLFGNGPRERRPFLDDDDDDDRRRILYILYLFTILYR